MPTRTAGTSASVPVAGHYWPTPPQETLRYSQTGLTVSCGDHCSFSLDPSVHKVLFVPYKSLWQVWVFILTWWHPFYRLIAAFPLSLNVRYLLGGCQHPPVHGCSAASCNFGVLTEEDERTSLCSTIWTEKHKLLPQGIRVQKRGLQGEYPPHHESWRVPSKFGVLVLTAPTLAFGLWPLFVCLFGLVVFLMLNFMSCLYILEINPLLVASFAIIFSHSESCLFILFIVSFAMQKILHLIRPHLFIFVFIFINLGDESKRILLWFMSKSVLPFSSKSF